MLKEARKQSMATILTDVKGNRGKSISGNN